jgi:hypothetical protein
MRTSFPFAWILLWAITALGLWIGVTLLLDGISEHVEKMEAKTKAHLEMVDTRR